MDRLSLLSLLLVSPLALTGACGAVDDEYKSAVPSQSAVTIHVPSKGASGSTSGGIGVTSAALLGQTSEYYLTTYEFSSVVNGSAIALLGMVKAITANPSTSATATSRTWGPYTPGGLDPLTYRLLVTKLAANQFTFSIDARARASTSDADFLAMLDGEITKGTAADTGKGTMTLHFDNSRKLRPEVCEQGSIAFLFDNTQPTATLDVAFAAFANNNPKNVTCKSDTPANASYHYDRDAAGAGNFVFSIAENIHKPAENKPLLEQVTIRSRWTADGPGRSDVRIEGGEVTSDLKANGFNMTSVTASQCWDSGFATVYETSAPAALKITPTDGDAGKCAFTSEMLP